MKHTSLTPEQQQGLLSTLQHRFKANTGRHPDLSWEAVEKRLAEQPGKLATLYQMEQTGGEPDVVLFDPASGEITFFDCRPQSPDGRRSLCYDPAALDSRKANKPAGSALGLAADMGATLLTQEEYRFLQTLGEFDTKTSSWVLTPDSVRQLGGAFFCDRRYDTVFVYHNGAESYYSSRGFRSSLRV